MRLDAYMNQKPINEKVNKKEQKTALKNSKILIGAEFEFIMDDVSEFGSGYQDMYENALSDWNSFKSDMDDARSEYEEADSESIQMQQEITNLEEKKDEGDETVYEHQEKLDELQAELEDAEAEDEPDEDQVETLQIQVDYWNDKVNDSQEDVDKLQNDIDNLESEAESFDDSKYDNVYLPTMGVDYIEYMGYAFGSVTEIDSYMIALGEEDMPDEPEEPYDETPSGDEIEDAYESSGVLDDAPFDNYKFGEYGEVDQRVGSKTWAIEPDESLSAGGIEIKSPPMPLPDFIKMLPEMFEWIRDHGHTDSSTGFHIHMSVKGVKDLSKSLDPVKLMLFTDEGKIFHYFKSREGAGYAKSVHDKLKSNGRLKRADMQKLFDTKKLSMAFATDHSDAVNFNNWEDGHMEFRYMGGSNYETKGKQVTEIIANYAHNMGVALDPDYKKGIYIKKLNRIFNKVEMYAAKMKWETVKYYIADEKRSKTGAISSTDMIELETIRDKYLKQYEGWKKIYKFRSKTMGFLRNNGSFYYETKDELSKEIQKHLSKPGAKVLEWGMK